MGKTLFMLDESGNAIPAGTGSYMQGRTIILRASGWVDNLQTVDVDGVTADKMTCHVVVNPDPEYFDAYVEAGIRCTNQGAETLTFKAQEQPAGDVVVDVVVAK